MCCDICLLYTIIFFWPMLFAKSVKFCTKDNELISVKKNWSCIFLTILCAAETVMLSAQHSPR